MYIITANRDGQLVCEEKETIFTRIDSFSSSFVTACAAIAMDGAKLPFYLILKGISYAQIERSLRAYLPYGIHDCVQHKACVDDPEMKMLLEKACKSRL